jgi:hypothetical protein
MQAEIARVRLMDPGVVKWKTQLSRGDQVQRGADGFKNDQNSKQDVPLFH